jgi:hypothetical protein
VSNEILPLPPKLPEVPKDAAGLPQFLLDLARALGDATWIDLALALPWAAASLVITVHLFRMTVELPRVERVWDPAQGRASLRFHPNVLGDLLVIWVLVAWIGLQHQMLAVMLAPVLYGGLRKLYERFSAPKEPPSPPPF